MPADVYYITAYFVQGSYELFAGFTLCIITIIYTESQLGDNQLYLNKIGIRKNDRNIFLLSYDK